MTPLSRIRTTGQVSGAGLVVMAAMLWGTTGTAQSFAPTGAQPEVVGTLRLLIGGIALLLIAIWRGRLVNPLRWPRVPLVLAVIGVAAYQICFFSGIARTGVALGTIVGIGSAPIMGGLLDWLVNRTQLTARWMSATALAIIGCVLLVLPGGEASVDLIGVLLAISAGFAYAVYTIASKRLLTLHDPSAIVAVIFSIAALFLSPILLLYPLAWVVQPAGIMVVLHLGILTMALSYLLFSYGLTHVTASTAVTLTLAEPLTAGILGVVLVGERLTASGLIGIVLLFYGLWRTSTSQRVETNS